MSKKLPNQETDFSSWYTQVVNKAGLADYGPVKGTMVIKPYGFQLWDTSSRRQASHWATKGAMSYRLGTNALTSFIIAVFFAAGRALTSLSQFSATPMCGNGNYFM